jgi:8-oxo-dGTP diphosphatase
VVREYPSQPVVGVAAVVLRDTDILLVRRGREPAKGTWGLPGGVVELGETLAQAARREVQEECAVEIEVGPVVGVFEPMQRDSDGRLQYHYVVIDLLARHLAGEPRADDDAEDARWIALDQLDGLPMQRETREIIRRAAAMAQPWPDPAGGKHD